MKPKTSGRQQGLICTHLFLHPGPVGTGYAFYLSYWSFIP